MTARLILVLLLTMATVASSATDNCQHKLISELLSPDVYDTSMRPVTSFNQTVNINISSSLSQITDLDEHKQVLHINMWFVFSWYDPHFVWNTSEYCDIVSLRVDNWRVWKPDLVLYNSISEENMGTELFAPTHLRIYANGLVQWPTLAIIRATCRVFIHDFPFDQQTCSMTVGSWTQDTSMLDLHVEEPEVDLDSYVENGEWELVRFPSKVTHHLYPSSVYPYAHVIYQVDMKRRPLFYLFNLLLPMILLITVGILAFCLAPDTGQKIQLSTTVLLTMMLFQVMLSDKLPPTSDSIPLLTQFFATSIVLLVISICSAVMVLALFHNAAIGVDVPSWLSAFVLRYMSPLVCLKGRTKETLKYVDPLMIESTSDNSLEVSAMKPVPQTTSLFDNKWNTKRSNSVSPANSREEKDRHADGDDKKPEVRPQQKDFLLKDLVQKISHVCDVYLKSSKQKLTQHAQKSHWYAVICVIDRLLMLVLTMATLLACIIIFLVALL